MKTIFISGLILLMASAICALEIPQEKKSVIVNRAPLKADAAITHKIILEKSQKRPMTAVRKQELQKLFLEKYDLNKNGKLDPEELEVMKRDRVASSHGVRNHLRKKMVMDNNGKIDHQQLRNFMERTGSIR